jgi:hypothetical protein
MCSHRTTSLQLTISAVPRLVRVRSQAMAAKTNMETSTGPGPVYSDDHRGL